MNIYEEMPIFENSKETINDQIDNLRENIGGNSLEETLGGLLEIFSNNSVETKQTSLVQSRVASLLDYLMEDWQKNGKSISDLKKEVSSFFESKDNLPDFFKDVRPEQLEKKQPSVIDSIQETLERF